MTLRVSISAALVTIGIFAGVLAGFRYGLDRGQRAAAVELEQAEPRGGRHKVSGIVLAPEVAQLEWPDRPSPRVHDLLVAYILENIEPNDWSTVGGPFEISLDADTEQVSVFCRGSTHERIEEFLEECRGDSSRLNEFVVGMHKQAVETERRQTAWMKEKISAVQRKVEGSIALGANGLEFIGPFEIHAIGNLYRDVSMFVFYPEPSLPGTHSIMGHPIRGYVQLRPSTPDDASTKVPFSKSKDYLFIDGVAFVIGSVNGDLVLVNERDTKESIRITPAESIPGEQ